MAESVVSFLVERFGDLLIQEAVFLRGVSGQVQSMQAEMKRMQCFFKDADAIQEKNERVRNWVAEIRDVAYDAEDVIDRFILKVSSRRRGGLKGVLKRCLYIFDEKIELHKVGKRMEVIQAKIHNITNSLQNYGIRSIDHEREETSSTNESQQELRRSYSHVEEDDVIGLEKDTKALVEELIKEEVQLRVVSIVGMGGLGKTTLAKKVYNHDVIKRHFDCTAWVFISQQCRIRDVRLEILNRVVNPTNAEREINEKMKDAELVKQLYKILEGKRYLVVLDDVWSTDTWDRLRPSFPNGKSGSKFMLTTRNKAVAAHADSWSDPYELRYLTEEESWELLCSKAFPKNLSPGCPPGFEQFKQEIVGKCGGLPLAVVVVGGLLAMKKSLDEWEMVISNISPHLNKDEQEQVLGILALSFNNLPYHLKPCFLYLGMFPEDFAIPVGTLIKLWISEGFVPQPQQRAGGETMEEMAKLYLEELIHRCMVQVGERSSTRGIKTCRVHDLMRDLCLLKAREYNFLEIYNQENMEVDNSNSVAVSIAKSRRFAIHFGEQRCDTNLFEREALNLRSLLLFVPSSQLIREKQVIKDTYKYFKLLRVLEMERAVMVEGLPTEIGNLIHLRYLGLKYTHIKKLPRSIGKLRSLQTLDLRIFKGTKVPDVIWKMERLRHLYLFPSSQSNTELRIDTLRNLQTLKSVKAGSWIEKGHLAKLTNIRRLHIDDISSSEQAKAVLESPVMDRLLSLSLVLHDDDDQVTFPNLTPLRRCHHLSKLRLLGRMQPYSCDFLPPNLCKLVLVRSSLEQDQMATLEKMTNLRILSLCHGSYIRKEMISSAQGFPQLELLYLLGISDLQEWRVEEGAMPRLRRLDICGCHNLMMVPEGLRFLTTLRELEIRWMPRVFEDRLRPGGADYCKLEIIIQRGAYNSASTSISYRGGRYQGRGRGYKPSNRSNIGPTNQRGAYNSASTSISRPTCQVCGIRGHSALRCWYRFDENYQQDDDTTTDPAHHAFAAMSIQDLGDTSWIPDTGATTHASNEPGKISNLIPYSGHNKLLMGDGSPLCITHTDYSAHKLSPRSALCIFIGYSTLHKGYRCMRLTDSRVFVSRHVKFDETKFPFFTYKPATVPSTTGSNPFVFTTPSAIPLHSSPPTPPNSALANPPPIIEPLVLPEPPLDHNVQQVAPVFPSTLGPAQHPMVTRSRDGTRKSKIIAWPIVDLLVTNFFCSFALLFLESQSSQDVEIFGNFNYEEILKMYPCRSFLI
ncbi:hypothetical protein HHK36_007754 [Tetracentron sinense]|uniref:Uncharacterized protein n=1 Tax=Tetracentron sinense TaxID=13715 RepID=A0A835DMK2_TETSI|nr:hypothetical protein HHK36_007754 [Tetracentron sinense]